MTTDKKMEFNSKVMIGLAIKSKRREYLASWIGAHEYKLDTTFWAKRIEEINDAHSDLEAMIPWHSVGEYKAAA